MGIDGGGTCTKAVVSDEMGVVLCNTEGGSINYYAISMDESRKNLQSIIDDIKKGGKS